MNKVAEDNFITNTDSTDTAATGTTFFRNISSEDFIEVNSGGHRIDLLGFWIGVALSVSSSIFIGASFIIKKRALLRLSKGGQRANQGGHGYLKDCLWWTGFLSMGVGEAANFIAYAFAPASLVSALGVLSVLVATILASKYLKERLNILGKLGCFIVAVGSTVIVIHAPLEKEIQSIDDLQEKLIDPQFIIYVVSVIATSLFLIYHCRPRCSDTSTKTLLIWTGVCSMIGSLSVMFCKGVGLAFTVTFGSGPNQFTNWVTWLCIIALILCITVQMNFLNKALDTFNTAVVTPIYYVFFTTCVIIASAILFREFAYLAAKDWVGLLCGFFTVLGGIILLHFCKNYDITLEKLAAQINVVHDSEKGDDDNMDIEFSLSDSSSGSNLALDNTRNSTDGRGPYGALKMRESILAESKSFKNNNGLVGTHQQFSTEC